MISPPPIQAAPPHLTPDAWATLVAAFIGASVALAVVWVQRVLDNRDRRREAERRSRVFATALLFEIDNFYKWWVRELREFLAQWSGQGAPPRIKSVDGASLAVYSTGAAQIGNLPQELVKQIVNWYGFARSFVATLAFYSRNYDGGAVGQARCFNLIEGIKGKLQGMSDLTFCACGLLCEYAKVSFEAPLIYVADDKTVSNDARTVLSNVREILAQKAGSG